MKQLRFLNTFDEKVEHSLNIIRERERDALDMSPDGYDVGFSGGKDSVVVYDLVQTAGVKFWSHYAMTTVDPPEVRKFIREHYPEVKVIRPPKSMFQLIEKKMMPPTRRMRYCCGFLKEFVGDGCVVLTGIRAEESSGRAKRGEWNKWNRNKTLFNPIFYWNEADVWEYIEGNNLPYLSLYDEGHSRVGCVGCPMAGVGNRKMQFERWPKFKKAYLLAFKKMIEARKRRGKGVRESWSTPEKVFDWWMSEPLKNDESTQKPLF